VIFGLLSVGLLYSQITIAEFNAGINREDDNYIYSRVNGQNYVVDKATRRIYQTWVNSVLQPVNVGTESITQGQNINFYITRGEAALTRGNSLSIRDAFHYFNDAINYFNMALIIDQNNADANYGRAEAYYNKARSVYTQTPIDVYKTANINLSVELFNMALNDINNAIRINSRNGNYYLLRARIYARRNDQNAIQNAINDYSEAIRLLPPTESLYTEVCNAYRNRALSSRSREDIELAINLHRRAIELFPRNAAYYRGIATVCNDHSQFDNAIIWINRAIEIEPNSALNYLNLVMYNMNKNDYRQARIAVNRAMQLGLNMDNYDNQLRQLGY